jgi:hypothetical protein
MRWNNLCVGIALDSDRDWFRSFFLLGGCSSFSLVNFLLRLRLLLFKFLHLSLQLFLFPLFIQSQTFVWAGCSNGPRLRCYHTDIWGVRSQTPMKSRRQYSSFRMLESAVGSCASSPETTRRGVLWRRMSIRTARVNPGTAQAVTTCHMRLELRRVMLYVGYLRRCRSILFQSCEQSKYAFDKGYCVTDLLD